MNQAFLNLKLTANVTWHLIIRTTRVYLLAGVFVLILFLLQWLFNIDQLLEIVLGNNPLSVADRLDFLFDGFINIFRFVDDFVPVSMILIALMQSITLTLLFSYRSVKSLKSKQGASLGLSLLGIGCVACGGSVLTPILGAIAANISVSVAEAVSNSLLLLALVLSYISMNRATLIVAKKMPKS